VVLPLLLTAGAGLLWLWWGWQAEQKTIARLRETQQDVHVAAMGPPQLRRVLGGRLGYLTDRVDFAWGIGLGAAETEQLDFQSLTQMQGLRLDNCELSQRNLNSLADLKNLQELSLYNLSVEQADLAFIEKLPALITLGLQGRWVPSTGLKHLERLGHLKNLYLYGTGTTDLDLQYLRGLSSLESLNLQGNPISDAGLEHLQALRSLKRLLIDERLRDSPGISQLKRAIPGLEVIAY